MSAAPLPPAAQAILFVAGARAEDANRGIARLDPQTLAALGAATGSLVSITRIGTPASTGTPKGSHTAYARALPLRPGDRGRNLLQIDGATRGNARAAIGDSVRLADAGPPARAVHRSLDGAAARLPGPMPRRALAGIPLSTGNRFHLPLVGGRDATLHVLAVQPPGPAFVDEATAIAGAAPRHATASAEPVAIPDAGNLRYEDLGGLSRVVEKVREVVELPLRNRAAFDHLGIAPPKGVLLVGPPGTGKTMIARAVAAESGAHFIAVNGPAIADKYYAASEQALRKVFETARKQAPSVIFIDEIDAIAPKREALSGEEQVERRIVAQLLALMDGLADRGEVVVLAATNLPDGLDPALRRPGRFDREIRVDPPDRAGRPESLQVHSRAMPLDPDVDLDALAGATHGHVGADLAAMCREAAVAALRRAGGLRLGGPEPDLATLRVTAAEFAAGLLVMTPTALREVFVEVPDVRWADVAGVDAIRATLVRAMDWPLRRPALLRPGRFDLVLEMPLPDLSARRAVLAIHTARMPLAADLDLGALAATTEGLVGADLAGLCRLAALAALERVAGHDVGGKLGVLETVVVGAADFAAALRRHSEGRTWDGRTWEGRTWPGT